VISIIRKSKNSTFYSIKELIAQNKFPAEMKYVTVDGKVLDSLEITETKFEIEAIKDIRFLTKEMYNGKEFDDLPQVKEAVGNGILMIVTQ
jgi:glutamine synthetase type III